MIKSLKYLAFHLVMVFLISCNVSLDTKHELIQEKADITIDEAPHPKNSLEWWYFTGHLKDSIKDKELGIEYVFFHFKPRGIGSYMMVNIAITDPISEAFYYDYKLVPLKDDLEPNLPLDLILNKKLFANLRGAAGNYQIAGRMHEYPVEFELKTKPAKPLVLHDGIGYEQYGEIARAGYFSYPRLSTEGKLSIKEQDYEVKGELWYDRQWNCSGVINTNLAWDWFSVQFNETNSELMLYRLYDIDKDSEIFGGTYTNKAGESTYLENDDIKIQEIRNWRSAASGTKYPVKWKLEVPKLKLVTDLEAVIPNQELKLKFWSKEFFYWEGMCSATGVIDGLTVNGNSYVEMTNRFRIPE